MNTTALISQIHASPLMAVLVVTGGGVQALADLLTVPGASRTVLEALVPYSEQSLAEFLGALPVRSVSIETAAALARLASQRAIQLRKDITVPVIGLSCTAALVTDRPKKGAHRAHVGVSSGAQTRVYSLTLQKSARDRHGEERLVSDLLLRTLAEMCGIDAVKELTLLAGEQVIVQDVYREPK
ncbi:MAG TPA: hypothetical protein VKK81_02625 [Candidatus Binatia bacterium]|nr:hypothetical protein [Candidatus Binatia bacterium]